LCRLWQQGIANRERKVLEVEIDDVEAVRPLLLGAHICRADSKASSGRQYRPA